MLRIELYLPAYEPFSLVLCVVDLDDSDAPGVKF